MTASALIFALAHLVIISILLICYFHIYQKSRYLVDNNVMFDFVHMTQPYFELSQTTNLLKFFLNFDMR